METANNAHDLADQFRNLAAYIDSNRDPAGALQRLADLARATVGGCEWCAITQASREPRTLAASDDTARLIDAIQLRAGEGPCLSAARDEIVIHIPDLTRESRWPGYVPAAEDHTPDRAI